MNLGPILIGFENLKVHTIVGLLDFERSTPQNILITLKLGVESEQIIQNQQNDDLGELPNYHEASILLEKFIQDQKFYTLEALVYQSAQVLFEQFPIVNSVYLKVCKPQAISKADFSFVEQTFFKK